MRFSQRMNLFKPSATLALNDRVLELRSEGVEIANLVVGDPDFNTPEFIKNAAKRAMAQRTVRIIRRSPAAGIAGSGAQVFQARVRA